MNTFWGDVTHDSLSTRVDNSFLQNLSGFSRMSIEASQFTASSALVDTLMSTSAFVFKIKYFFGVYYDPMKIIIII